MTGYLGGVYFGQYALAQTTFVIGVIDSARIRATEVALGGVLGAYFAPLDYQLSDARLHYTPEPLRLQYTAPPDGWAP